MKRMVEINDTLDETLDAARLDLRTWAKENPNETEPHDQIHEIADSATPIYTGEIRDLWYLYQNEFESAYEDAGIGNGTEDNYQQVCIYCYIESALWDEWREIESQREALADNAKLGGPGLNGYAYKADVYCEDCAGNIIDDLAKVHFNADDAPPEDTDTFPQPIFFGESDIKMSCAECGEYLYGPETSDVQINDTES